MLTVSFGQCRNTARLKDEHDLRCVFHANTKCWSKWSATNEWSRRWQRYDDQTYNGQCCETSADKYETVWPIFQMWNGVWQQRHRRKAASSLELLHDLPSSGGCFNVDQRGSNVHGVHRHLLSSASDSSKFSRRGHWPVGYVLWNLSVSYLFYVSTFSLYTLSCLYFGVMFSVFTANDKYGSILFFKFIVILHSLNFCRTVYNIHRLLSSSSSVSIYGLHFFKCKSLRYIVNLLVDRLCILACRVFRHVRFLPVDAFFFKFAFLSYAILCAVSQSTYFAVSYSGKLDRMLERLKLGGACVIYSRRIAVIYTSVAWVMVLVNVAFSSYAIFSGDFMDIMLSPITTQFYVADLFVPRIVLFLCKLYLTAAWIFSHAMTLMLATIFHHQFKELGRRFVKIFAERDQRRLSDSDIGNFDMYNGRGWFKFKQFHHGVSDSDIETIRQYHQEISMSVNETDNFLMFHNAGAFCCQLVNVILHLYDSLFFHATDDLAIITMRAFWVIGLSCGLSVTTAGGIIINHYVSTSVECLLSVQLMCRYIFMLFWFYWFEWMSMDSHLLARIKIIIFRLWPMFM